MQVAPVGNETTTGVGLRVRSSHEKVEGELIGDPKQVVDPERKCEGEGEADPVASRETVVGKQVPKVGLTRMKRFLVRLLAEAVEPPEHRPTRL